MPDHRTNPLSKEERFQEAMEIKERERREKEAYLKKLYASTLYRCARLSSIFLLWLSQIVLIDEFLPFSTEKDQVEARYTDRKKYPTELSLQKLFPPASTEVGIKSSKGYYFPISLDKVSDSFLNDDSITITRSFLLREMKSIHYEKDESSFLIASAITYRCLPFLVLGSLLSLLFLFIKEIESKFFTGTVLGLNTFFVIITIWYAIAKF